MPFEFEEIKNDTSIDQQDKMQEIERRSNLGKMRFAIGLEYNKYQIKEAVRKMHAALARKVEG